MGLREAFLSEVRLSGYLGSHPILLESSLRPTTIALRLGRERASHGVEIDRIIDELDRNIELRCCRTMCVSRFNMRNKALSEFKWMSFVHIITTLVSKQGIIDHIKWESWVRSNWQRSDPDAKAFPLPQAQSVRSWRFCHI